MLEKNSADNGTKLRERATRATRAIKAHALAQFRGSEKTAREELREDPASLLVDLLTDLRHFAAWKRLDFASAVSISQAHHYREHGGDWNRL